MDNVQQAANAPEAAPPQETHGRTAQSINKANDLDGYWLPSLCCLIWLIIAESSLLFNPFTESSTGLQLNVQSIVPESVFQPALDRVNFTNPMGFRFGWADTGLEPYYKIDERGFIFHAKYDEFVDSSSHNNGSLETNDNGSHFTNESLYKDFPRALIYNSTSSLLHGNVPILTEDDINVPLVPEETISQVFEKALFLRNKYRVDCLKVTAILTVTWLILFSISMKWGGHCVLIPVSVIPWAVKAVYITDWAEFYVTKNLENEPLIKSFKSDYEDLGLSLYPIFLAYDYNFSVLFAVVTGLSISFTVGIIVCALHSEYAKDERKKREVVYNSEKRNIV